MKDVKILVATQKQIMFPLDSMYFPIQVGAFNKSSIGYIQDSKGDNISEKNPNFCELTGTYWAWKNLEFDYLGLVHYRRFFSLSHKKSKKNSENILKNEDIDFLCNNYKIILPKKRHYYIETLYSHYAHTFYANQLDEAIKIINEKHPEQAETVKKTLRQRSGYMFNMFIMEKSFFHSYCEWLFEILFELEKRMKVSNPELFDGSNPFQSRFIGRISERLFNVWLNINIASGLINKKNIKEIPFVYLGKVDFIRKIKSFLKAKIKHEKYDKSF